MVTIGRARSQSGCSIGTGRRIPSSGASGPFGFCYLWLTHFLVGVFFFYCGLWLGSTTTTTSSSTNSDTTARVLEQAAAPQQQTTTEDERDLLGIPPSIRGLMVGTATVPRDDFIAQFDIGVPWDEVGSDTRDVLLLYGSQASLPLLQQQQQASEPSVGGGSMKHYESSQEATQNCHSMKVILTQPAKGNECLAVVSQWNSFHLHHFLRLKKEHDNHTDAPLFRPDYPFRYVSRRHELNGKIAQLPRPDQTARYWPVLVDYLQKLDTTLARLKPIAAQVAGSGNNNNTIVVLVCNLGQSELLMNFVCATRGRGLSLDRVLVFCTDPETYQLAKSLGVTAWDVQDAFGEMPKDAAKQYGDKRFRGMMLSKVYCVHLINTLGYNVLFQDVDVVWYRDPLTYFLSQEQSGDFDFYFQDDGAHTNRYAPYSPNSGFYYVRQNERTRYFFDVFLRMGDLIVASGSHQAALNDLLTDQASSQGLKVKVFQRDSPLGEDFPGGVHYHHRKDFMKDMIAGTKTPYIFHMSWTTNKENKRRFLQQMGDWHVKDVCIGKTHDEIVGTIGDTTRSGGDLSQHCCSAEPLIHCHYRDKPSKTPCKTSDPIDKGRPSFW